MYYTVVVYDVTVHTGDLWNAGTKASVFVTLHGERGDTGVREFYKLDGQPNLEKGEVSSKGQGKCIPLPGSA